MNRQSIRLFALLVAVVFAVPSVFGAGKTCESLFQSSGLHAAPTQLLKTPERLSPGTPFFNDSKAFELLAQRVLEHRHELFEILAAVDNHHGAKYEIEQVIKTLRGVKLHELDYLKQISGVKNIAVYGSTNIPLYTLVLHAIIPASTGAHVWFRTPQASRETYVAAMEKIRQILPEVDLSHIHLLVDPADVQYDNFRKQHVLGLNRKGTRPLREPSEVVIFTGSPKTGEEIRATIATKLTELKSQLPSVRTVFMQFGSGLNPVVVTELAAGVKLEPAVRAAIQAIRINSSQDCIAPKFYALHSRVADIFIDRVKDEISKLRYGSRNDLTADYSSLTFAENVDGLVEFKERWKKYLVTPQATIDTGLKRVDPHVFVFPFEMFTQVELADHYAPFLVMFKYSSKQELEQIANDPRVKSRAMFASVFGDSSSTDMVYLRKLFEDNFHATILNQSVFVEESGNFPFGGYSPAASSATLFSRHEGGELKTFTSARPLLFSRDAKAFFSKSQAQAPYAELAKGVGAAGSRRRMKELIDLSLTSWAANTLGKNRDSLEEPERTLRPHGLKAIREAIARGGLHRVVEGAAPRTSLDKDRDALFYGDDVLYTVDARGEKIRHVPGVVLHPSWINRDISMLNSYRGELNPHLGFAFLHPLLFTNRKAEFALADAIWPGSMPRSLAYHDVKKADTNGELEAGRLLILKRIDGVIEQRREMSLAERAELTSVIEKHLERFFDLTNRVFPQGAFIKNFSESTTGDLGNQITSFSQNAHNYALQFVERFSKMSGAMKESLGSDESRALMTSGFYETGSKMVTKLLTNPNELLIQERVKIAKTDLGFPVEIRVDFVDGEPVHSRGRYTHEYLGPEMKEAEEVLRRFFARAPEPVQLLAGGADLARLEDGRWIFIEFNFGANSGTLQPNLFPIESNLFLSKLKGRNTPLITQLEAAFSGGVGAQRAYLTGIKAETDKWYKASIDDMSLAEVSRYFRDRYLSEWLKNPTAASAQVTLNKIRHMLNGFGGPNNRDLPLLILGAENFINKNLMQGE
jgi:acyl-CoA reductase-like NAD-dependent aldehyde dehydrogenase